MESISSTTTSGEMTSRLQNETGNSLDSLVHELARKKQQQRKKDEPQCEHADALPLLSLPPRPLPPALYALRRGGHERGKLSLEHSTKPDKTDAEGGITTNHMYKTRAASSNLDKSHPLQTSALTGKSSVETPTPDTVHLTQVTDTDSSQGPRSGIVSSASVVSAPTLKEVGERKPPDETGVSILPTSQPASLTSPRVRIESPNIMPRQEPVPMQTAEVSNSPQGGMTYRFSRWGADYRVNVQGQTGGTLLLQPSDTLVAQQLSDQWQSGNPQKWQLAQDGGEGRGQRHQQEHEEDEA